MTVESSENSNFAEKSENTKSRRVLKSPTQSENPKVTQILFKFHFLYLTKQLLDLWDSTLRVAGCQDCDRGDRGDGGNGGGGGGSFRRF